MKARIVEQGGIEALLGQWAGSRTVMVPGPAPSFEAFVQWDGQPFSLPPVTTTQSVKGMCFPRSEALFSYVERDGDVEFSDGVFDGRVVVVGARPCDARAALMVDRVLIDEPDSADQAYRSRRENCAMVVFACDSPGPACFCTALGGGPHDPAGADVILTAINGRYLVQPLTDRGEELLAESSLPEAADGDVELAAGSARTAVESMVPPFAAEGLSEHLDQLFDHEYWGRLHEKCLGCGVCTWLCPTCHCFDVTDEPQGGGHTRFRTWDSCQFPLFTLHTSGHNPRESGLQRLRQRILHKFNYYPHRYGEPACVGCGRCVQHCPVNLDIRQVLEELGGIGR